MASRSKRTTRKLNPGVYARPDGNLQAHMAIPADVRFAFGGKSKIVRSLGTSDPAQANRIHAQLVTKQEAAYDLIRKGTASSAFEAFARRLHESQLDYIDEQNDLVSFNGYASNPFLQQTFGQRLNSADPEELAATVGWAADWFFAEQTGVDPDDLSPELRASPAYRQVMRECAEVLKDSFRAGREAMEGRTVSPPRYPALRTKPKESEDGNRAKNDRGEMPIMDYHEKIYIPANIEKIEPNTLKVKMQSIALFAELIGNRPVFMITRADVKDFQSDLLFLPDQRTIPANLKDKSLREIVNLQKAGSITLKRPAAGTVNKHVSNVKVVLKAAHEAGHMRINPAVDMMNVTPTASNPRTEKRAFTRIELQQIFALPMFAGCAGDTERGRFQPGPVKIRDERFWIPVLLFLTGARADEVAGLEKADIKFQNGQARLVFRFTPLRRLKNRDSERVIPLHPWALDLGFEAYVNGLPTETTYLFPEIVAEASKGDKVKLTEETLNGTSVFRQFNRTHLRHIGLHDDPAVSLHSFRHTFEEGMTGHDIPEEVMFRLTGRSVNGSRRTYTKSLPHDEEGRDDRAVKFRPHVEKIDFGGVNISHLKV